MQTVAVKEKQRIKKTRHRKQKAKAEVNPMISIITLNVN